MILLQSAPADSKSWIEIALREGGLAAVCIILLVLLYILLKLYLKERKSKDDSVEKFIADTASLEREHKQQVVRQLKEQAEEFKLVIDAKDATIKRLEDKNDDLEKQFRADLTKFLQESIEARHEITQSMEQLGRENKENSVEIIRTLQTMS